MAALRWGGRSRVAPPGGEATMTFEAMLPMKRGARAGR
jgi:hypothetical protein